MPIFLCHREINNLFWKVKFKWQILPSACHEVTEEKHIYRYIISPSALDGDYLSHSRYCHFTPREKQPLHIDKVTGWDPQPVCTLSWERKSLVLPGIEPRKLMFIHVIFIFPSQLRGSHGVTSRMKVLFINSVRTS